MAGKVKPIPEGYSSVTPYLIVDDAAKAIQFYEKVFGAKELMRMPAPGDRIAHAELEIGDSRVMLSDENPEMNARSPRSVGGTPISLMLYVEEVDKTVDRAVASGAKLRRRVEDQFWGDRMGGIEDPFGHEWNVATHVEDVSPEEMQKRLEEHAASAK
jgi:PhnB protein